MTHQTVQGLLDYWNELRGSRPAPKRSEIEPRDLKRVLPHVFILERNDRWTYRFRLAGTGLCNVYGMEFRRHNMAALWQDESQQEILKLLNDVTGTGAIGLVEYTAETPDNRQLSLEMVLLPLAQDNGAVTRVLGAIVALDEFPWVGEHMLVRQWVDRIQRLDPEELPAAPPVISPARKVIQAMPPRHSPIPSLGTRRQKHTAERPYLRLVRDASLEIDKAK
ncbi:PAS domain-containing protein [Parvibaculaceae bacterium PLY_AMNH_Bact1]|nr:PAS domain-containing protein [Parvibaculaceae bacterium PLY_AMNH_Bact1]